VFKGKDKDFSPCLRKYFWDVDSRKIDFFKKNKFFVIKRILEYGDEKSVNWLWKNYSLRDIKYALRNFRGYSRKSADFWAKMLEIPPEQVLSLRIKSGLWNN